MNVAFNERPMADEFVAATLVGTNGLAGVVVVFKDGVMLETRL